MAIELAAVDLRSVFAVISKASMYTAPDGGDQVWPTFELDGAGAGLFQVAASFYAKHLKMLSTSDPVARAANQAEAVNDAVEAIPGLSDYLSQMQQALSTLTPQQVAVLQQLAGGGDGDGEAPLEP